MSQTDEDPSEAVPSNDIAHLKIYHEKQSKQLCALHALNNLFQDPNAFTKQHLDAICKDLAPESRLFNPHRSILGLGCYDVNVILSALAKKGYEAVWFDKRKDISSIDLTKVYGLILNIRNSPSTGFFIPFNFIPLQAQVWSSRKHWIAIKKIDHYYYNLDSKLTSPSCIGTEDALQKYLKFKCSVDQVEILIVALKQQANEVLLSKNCEDDNRN